MGRKRAEKAFEAVLKELDWAKVANVLGQLSKRGIYFSAYQVGNEIRVCGSSHLWAKLVKQELKDKKII